MKKVSYQSKCSSLKQATYNHKRSNERNINLQKHFCIGKDVFNGFHFNIHLTVTSMAQTTMLNDWMISVQ
jgi:hypothetical protein